MKEGPVCRQSFAKTLARMLGGLYDSVLHSHTFVTLADCDIVRHEPSVFRGVHVDPALDVGLLDSQVLVRQADDVTTVTLDAGPRADSHIGQVLRCEGSLDEKPGTFSGHTRVVVA